MKHWNDILASSNGAIIAWAASRPWAEAMRHCLQDAVWHAEGDVWTHTLLVCGEVEKLPEYRDLPRSSQLALLFTALLHDAGKPATTHIEPETGRTRSPRHSVVGESLARGILRELQCPLEERERIARLVRYHGRPVFLLDKEAPEAEVIRHSWLVPNDLLHLFTLADYRGRDTAENTREESMLYFWKDLAKELGCYADPYPFVNDQARFLFYRDSLSDLFFVPHEHHRSSVILMSGIPGTGKDTWLERHHPGLPVVSLDNIRRRMGIEPTDNQGHVIQAAREECRVHLRAGRDFAFNATNVTASLRRKWIDLCHDYEARIHITYLEPPLPTILRQNQDREHAVPERVIRHLLEKTDIPTVAEAHSVTWLTGAERGQLCWQCP